MEYWDIYDKNKQLTGRTMKRNDWILKDDEYHLSVLGIVVRPDGRFLITKRIETKHWAPLWWEVPGGGVRAGESSEDAVIREVKEETGLDVEADKRELMLTYHRENPGSGDNYFVDVYRIVKDFTPEEVHIQVDEAVDFQLAELSVIEELAGQGIFLHYDSIRSVLEAPLT